MDWMDFNRDGEVDLFETMLGMEMMGEEVEEDEEDEEDEWEDDYDEDYEDSF